MPKKYRLSRTDFLRMRGFRRLHGALFSLSWGMLPDRPVSGAACVVSAKTAGSAAVRNGIKRRCRNALLCILKDAHAPIILVLHAKKPSATASSRQMSAEIEDLYRRATMR